MKIDSTLVQQLVREQFPKWANLPIRPVATSGWDNRTFHLGNHMTIRLPSAAEYAPQVNKEQYWLSKLAPSLPLAIPTPVAKGEPGCRYPWQWSVYQWIDGETAAAERIEDLDRFALSLADFVIALHMINSAGGPSAGPHNFFRGGPLATYDADVRHAIKILGNAIDHAVTQQIWEAVLCSEWKRPPVWVHGDISIGNLLVKEGRLTAVIDFGSLGVGDPACDLVIAWTFFESRSRNIFRAALLMDNETWARARGWALWKALIVYAQLEGTNSHERERALGTIDEVVSDFRSSS